MFDLKNNVVRRYDRTIPIVNFDNEQFELELINLIDTDRDIYQYMGLLIR